MALLPLRPDTVHFRAAVRLYEAIHGERPVAAASRFRRHGRRDSYRGRVAVEGGDVVGFAYGHDSMPDGRYHRALRRALPRRAGREWLRDAFEMAELAVAPRARRRGLATHLVERVLDGSDRRTAVLTAERDAVGARGFYEATGWTRVYEPFVVGDTEMAVFGREL